VTAFPSDPELFVPFYGKCSLVFLYLIVIMQNRGEKDEKKRD
jgi:hypothetical protein